MRDYGDEWKDITKAAKKAFNHRCSKCKRVFNDVELDTHHIIPISVFIEEGYVGEGPAHYCYGIMTTKEWHVEGNLRVDCMKCHTKEPNHERLAERYRNIVIVGNRRIYKEDLDKFR